VDVIAPVQLLQSILRASQQARVSSTALTHGQVASTRTGMQVHSNAAVELSQIPLKRLRSLSQSLYVSELPSLLARQGFTPASVVADELLHQVWQMQASSAVAHPFALPIELLQGFTVSKTAKNTLRFEFHDPAIAYWLAELMTCDLNWEVSRSPQFLLQQHQRVFTIQHAMARCCSWLRHAEQAHLIQLDTNNDPHHWSLVTPIGWLKAQQLQFTHAAERQLANQLVAVLDIWFAPPQVVEKHLFLLAEAISQTFQEVHRMVPVFGQHESCDRLKCHLGLLFITQRVLRQLLQTLKIVAPTEL